MDFIIVSRFTPPDRLIISIEEAFNQLVSIPEIKSLMKSNNILKKSQLSAEFKVVMYSLSIRLRLSKIRHIKIIWLKTKTKTKSDKSYFDFQIKTKTKTKTNSKVSIQILSYNWLEMIRNDWFFQVSNYTNIFKALHKRLHSYCNTF